MADELVIDEKPLTSDDILSKLNEENEEETNEKPKEEITEEGIKEPITEDEGRTDDKKEEEIKIEEEEKYEEIPKRQAILKEFPELFKKFPAIEHAIYREQQYAEIFPTLDDAKEANARLDDFKAFENELFDGNIEGVLRSVKGTNDKAFSKITSGLLQTLQKVDEKAYYGTLNHVLKNAIATAYNTGKQNEDEQLQIAAQLLHKFIYGNHNITLPEPQPNKEPDEKEVRLQQRERSFIQQQLTTAVSDVTTRTDNVIKSTVDKYIDVKGVMTSYVKDKAIDDVMTEVRSSIGSDMRFRAMLDKMWEASARDNFSEVSKLKIRNALISKAKAILPGVIQKVKSTALKGNATRTREASESKDEKPISSGKPSNSSSKSGLTKDGKIPRGMSTLDFLSQD